MAGDGASSELENLRWADKLHRDHELIGPVGECECPSCHVHHNYRAQLADLQRQLEEAREGWTSTEDLYVERVAALTVERDALRTRLQAMREVGDLLASHIHDADEARRIVLAWKALAEQL